MTNINNSVLEKR